MASGSRSAPGSLTRQVAAILKQAMGDVTQRQLGRMTGLSQPQVSRYLAGKRVLDVEELDAICRALDLVAVDVLRDADMARAQERP